MTQRIPRRSRLASAIRAALRPATATALTVSLTLAAAGPVQAAMENGAPGKVALRPENQAARDEILFMDAHVVAPEKLLVGTKQGVETVILEEGRDALEQITEVLENRHPVAVHIVAHGENGRLQLGDTWLDARQLDANVALIRRWFAGSDGHNKPDLLLYACNLAEGAEGVAFIEKLAEIAGADVAASDDITGIDGDWDLEVETGDIEADLAFSEITIDDYQANLVTFTVSKTADTDDGTCDADCSLREAIEDANEEGGFDLVEASGVAGTITLECSEYGDIDIYEDVTIEGSGITALTVDGEEYCRIFDINLAGVVTISDLRLQEGYAEYGGCIQSTETDLTLNEVYFAYCHAEYAGGGLYHEGQGDNLTVRDSRFVYNSADSDDGGAVSFYDGGAGGATLLIENSDFIENYSDEEGGALAIEADNTEITIRDSYFARNYLGGEEGGAIFFQDEEGSTFLVENSEFYNNNIGDDGEEGGAIFFYADNTEITIRDSEFIENDAYDDGGAIGFEDGKGAESSEMLVENSYFYGNDAEYGEGGAINFDTYADSSLTIQDSEFVENEAYGFGGALQAYGESGDVTIRNSLFADNEADEGEYGGDGGGASFYNLDEVFIYASSFVGNEASDGGGIQVERNESVDIVNSTFSYNEAYDDGGAMELDGNESMSIRNTTIAFNDADEGGGIHSYANEDGGGSTTVVLRNTIVSDNTADEGPDLHGYSDTGDTPFFDAAFSLVTNISDIGPHGVLINEGGNIFGVSADLAPLDDTLGPTPVHVPDLESSPAIDTGDPAFVSPPDFDQTGTTQRVLGANIDMGSIEQEGVTRIIPTLSRVGLVFMGLFLAAAGFLGFRRKDQES